MKRLKRLGVFAAACAVAATPFALMGHASAEAPVNTANTTYNDYKKLPTIMGTQYENAKLFYTANTNIIVKDAGGDGGVPGNYNVSERYAIREPDQEVIFLLTGTTARDAFGDPADVIIRAHNLRKWDNPRAGEDQFGRIVLQSNICGIANSEASQAAPSETDCEKQLNQGKGRSKCANCCRNDRWLF